MRKIMIAAVAMLMSVVTVNAQQQMSEEERAKAMNERIERSAERMAKDFGLKDAQKDSFTTSYVAFQKEMFATNAPQGKRPEGQADQAEKEKSELTDAEATARIQENFERQAQQIATMQKRLEVQKKYSEKFAGILTPQQIVKVLMPQRQRRQSSESSQEGNGNRMRDGFGGPRGGFGGPGGGFGGPGF